MAGGLLGLPSILAVAGALFVIPTAGEIPIILGSSRREWPPVLTRVIR